MVANRRTNGGKNVPICKDGENDVDMEDGWLLMAETAKLFLQRSTERAGKKCSNILKK